MPHLDAKALSDDREGLDFLAVVLDVAAEHENAGWDVGEVFLASPVEPASPTMPARARRRKDMELVAEAA